MAVSIYTSVAPNSVPAYSRTSIKSAAETSSHFFSIKTSAGVPSDKNPSVAAWQRQLLNQLKKRSPENTESSGHNGGVGGNRTRVQTSHNKTFYKFSFRLIIEESVTENSPRFPYHLY